MRSSYKWARGGVPTHAVCWLAAGTSNFFSSESQSDPGAYWAHWVFRWVGLVRNQAGDRTGSWAVAWAAKMWRHCCLYAPCNIPGGLGKAAPVGRGVGLRLSSRLWQEGRFAAPHPVLHAPHGHTASAHRPGAGGRLWRPRQRL